MRQRRRTRLCALIVVMGACLLEPASPASAASCKGRQLMAKKSNVGKVERAIRCLLNRSAPGTA